MMRKKCACCGEAESADVAWCTECSIICKSCLAMYKKMTIGLKDHKVTQTEDQESLLQPPTKKRFITLCTYVQG